MLVPWPVEPPGSTAQSGPADQNRRSAICQPHSKLDFILRVNIYLLPFKTRLLPRKRTSPGRSFPWMIRQLRSLPPSDREQARYQTDRSTWSAHDATTGPNTINSVTHFARLTNTLEGVVSSLCLLRQVSSVSSRNRRYEHRPGADQMWLVSVNSWQANCFQTDGYLGIEKGVFHEWGKQELRIS